ncbi:MAG: hypothetical protein ACRER5_09305 [Pseudomonas sp.]
MTLLSLFSAVALGLALSAGHLASAWFFMGLIEDRAALRLACLVGLATVATAAFLWCLGMDPAYTTWWDAFVLSWLTGVAIGLSLLWCQREHALVGQCP